MPGIDLGHDRPLGVLETDIKSIIRHIPVC